MKRKRKLMPKVDEDTVKRMQEFFSRPGINKKGIAIEAGTTSFYINGVLNGTRQMTVKQGERILSVMRKYGF